MLNEENFKVGLLVTPDIKDYHVIWWPEFHGHVGEVLAKPFSGPPGPYGQVWVVWWPRLNVTSNWACHFLNKL